MVTKKELAELRANLEVGGVYSNVTEMPKLLLLLFDAIQQLDATVTRLNIKIGYLIVIGIFMATIGVAVAVLQFMLAIRGVN